MSIQKHYDAHLGEFLLQIVIMFCLMFYDFVPNPMYDQTFHNCEQKMEYIIFYNMKHIVY